MKAFRYFMRVGPRLGMEDYRRGLARLGCIPDGDEAIRLMQMEWTRRLLHRFNRLMIKRGQIDQTLFDFVGVAEDGTRYRYRIRPKEATVQEARAHLRELVSRVQENQEMLKKYLEFYQGRFGDQLQFGFMGPIDPSDN